MNDTLEFLNQIDEYNFYPTPEKIKTTDKYPQPGKPSPFPNPQIVDKYGVGYPSLPNFRSITSVSVREKMFGHIEFKVNADGNSVTITNDWVKNNIVTIEVPELIGIPTYGNKPCKGIIQCHKLAADPIKCLFMSWEAAGLMDRVIFWGGCWVPRLVRGSKSVLSNHSFGSAFDINTETNPMGVMPPVVGQPGCVRELVPMANNQGWFWGGHFINRKDGMHFELTILD